MAEEGSAIAATEEAPAVGGGKMTMVVGVDDSEPSYHALQWVLRHFFASPQPARQYRLVVVTAKPASAPAVGLAGPGGGTSVLFVDAELCNKAARRVIDKARDLCAAQRVSDAEFEATEGDARNVLCDAVEKHGAEVLAVGSHGYGAIKRALLGSVSDYCAHHAHCTVMIVKMPKHNKH